MKGLLQNPLRPHNGRTEVFLSLRIWKQPSCLFSLRTPLMSRAVNRFMVKVIMSHRARRVYSLKTDALWEGSRSSSALLPKLLYVAYKH